MQDCSDFIVKAMRRVDDKILQINLESIDRQRLRNKVLTQIVANIGKLNGMNEGAAYKKIDDIFETQLGDEIKRKL